MRRRTRLPKVPKKVLTAAVVVLAVVAAAWAAKQAGWLGGNVVGSLDMRPWRRASEAKPVGVRIERAVPPRAESVPGRPAETARLAIILDDWGMSRQRLADAIALKRPITLAVLPHLPHSTEIAQTASKNGLGVMLHMPMQAKSKGAPRESEVVGVDSSEIRIRRYLDEALASVPSARGVNNHQGSAATSDTRVMRTVLSHLHKKDLFFIDSFVIATTTGPAVAREVGIPFAKRDVFIDNELSVDAIKAQLRKAMKKARQNKTAIAIGHDKQPTIEAIRQMLPEIEKAGIRLVLAEDLVQ